MDMRISVLIVISMGMSVVPDKYRPYEILFCKVKDKLVKLLEDKPKLRRGLADTLKASVEEAKKTLNKELYRDLDAEFGGSGFPTTIKEWAENKESFLWRYAHWTPSEKGNYWRKEKDGYNAKLFDIISHFYWLITPNVDINVTTAVKPQEDSEFNRWLIEYWKVYEVYLDHPVSLTRQTLQGFIDNPDYHMDRFMKNKDQWKTFNEWFYRKFNDTDDDGITKLCPIDSPSDNRIITSPACCTYRGVYDIGPDGVISSPGKPNSWATVKGVRIGNIHDLLRLSWHSEHFYGGTFVHYFLSPTDYHRFHVPVSGKVVQVMEIRGSAYTSIKITNHTYEMPDDAKDGYEFEQSRGFIIIDTKYGPDSEGIGREHLPASYDIGKVAIIPIGMAQVSGVGLNEGLEGQMVKKGQEFGRFKFGGSDIIMLFKHKRQDLIFEEHHFNCTGMKAITFKNPPADNDK